MDSTCLGTYLYAGGFIQNTAPGTTIIYSKQANRWQQVIQPTKTMKDNSRRFQRTPCRSLGQNSHNSGPDGPLGRPPGLPQSPLILRRLVLLLTIYTIDYKVILGQLSQQWLGELTRINDVAIPCPLLHLESLPFTPFKFLGRYSSFPYIRRPKPPPCDTPLHTLHFRGS